MDLTSIKKRTAARFMQRVEELVRDQHQLSSDAINAKIRQLKQEAQEADLSDHEYDPNKELRKIANNLILRESPGSSGGD